MYVNVKSGQVSSWSASSLPERLAGGPALMLGGQACLSADRRDDVY